MATLSTDGVNAGPHRRRAYVREDQTVPADATTIDKVWQRTTD